MVTGKQLYTEEPLKVVLLFISTIFLRNTRFVWKEKNENAKILFLLSQPNCRRDIDDYMHRISKTVNSESRDLVSWRKSNSFALLRILRNLFYIGHELIHPNYYCKNFMANLFRMSQDMKLLDYQEDFKRYLINRKYNLCVVMYDANFIDNYASQYFQSKGLKVATLQHGVMLAPREGLEDNIDFKGVEFKGFTSNYFLAWNEFTRNEAVKSGIEIDRIVVCGCGKCVGQPVVSPVSNRNIGVILDGRYEEENNAPMISIVEQFAKQNGYHYTLRFHPAFSGNEYNDIIDKKIGSICDKDSSIYYFLNSVEFCVLANSTVLFELECMGMPFYRYSSANIKDKFKDYKVNSFTNLLEFQGLFDKRKDNDIKDVYRFRYDLFFKQFV
jgi:hypothetical protein